MKSNPKPQILEQNPTRLESGRGAFHVGFTSALQTKAVGASTSSLLGFRVWDSGFSAEGFGVAAFWAVG